jgi:hypothetical protein
MFAYENMLFLKVQKFRKLYILQADFDIDQKLEMITHIF